MIADRPKLVAADCLGRHVRSGERVTVALSGGIDSVALLHVIRGLRECVAAVHVDHGLSPNSPKWVDFCRRLCAEWNVPLLVRKVVVPLGSPFGTEASARKVRHEVFAALDSDWVLLGHHRGDRAETTLFNLLRGAGLRGMAAMPERSGRLLRPFLDVGREEIRAYVDKHHLRWVEDESNADTRYSRNFLRHSVLPLVKRRFPAAEIRLTAAARRLQEAADLLDDLARMDLGGQAAAFPLAVSVLANLPEPRARNVLRYVLYCSGLGIPSESRLVEAVRQIVTASSDRNPVVQLGRVRLVKRRDVVTIESQRDGHSLRLPPSR